MNYKVILNFKYFNYCKFYFYTQRVKDPRNEGHYSITSSSVLRAICLYDSALTLQPSKPRGLVGDKIIRPIKCYRFFTVADNMPEYFTNYPMTSLTLDAIACKEEDAVVIDYILKGR
jgi:hypothetical protein